MMKIAVSFFTCFFFFAFAGFSQSNGNGKTVFNSSEPQLIQVNKPDPEKQKNRPTVNEQLQLTPSTSDSLSVDSKKKLTQRKNTGDKPGTSGPK